MACRHSVVFPDDVVSVQLPDEEVAAPLFLLEGKRNAEVALVFTRGDRPEFAMVTGVSTGALAAPFVFLGPDYDPVLREVYTTLKVDYGNPA